MSLRRPKRRKQGGFVLLVVLSLLVLLTIVASLAYSRASDQVVMSTALMRQSMAQDRALIGMQRAVADLNRSPLPPYLQGLDLKPVCTNSKPETCTVEATLALVDNGSGPTDELGVAADGTYKGGGSQYMVEFHHWQAPGTSDPIYVVHAYGYHGFDPMVRPYATRLSSEIIVEVSKGKANALPPGYAGSGL